MGVAVDRRAGDVYTVGVAEQALSEYGLPDGPSSDGYVAKHRADGSFVWAFLLSGGGHGQLLDVAADSGTHRIYVTGYISSNTTITGTSGPSFVASSSGVNDVFLACFDSAGVLIWYAVEGGNGSDFGSGITLDANAVYVAGSIGNAANFDGAIGGPNIALSASGSEDWFVAKYNKVDGGLDWAVANINGSNVSRANAVTVDGTGVYVCGAFNGFNCGANGVSGSLSNTNSSAGEFDIFMFALRKADGLAFWGYGAGASGTDDEANGIAVDANGLYMAGMIEGNASFPPLGSFATGSVQDGYLSKHDPLTGNAQWVNVMGSTGGQDLQRVMDVDIDGAGKVLVTGAFVGSIRLPSNGSMVATLLSNGAAADIFVASIDSSGGLVFADRAGGTGDDEVEEVSAFDATTVYVGGSYDGSNCDFATFTPTSLPLEGSEDIFVAKYGLCFAQPDPSLGFAANPSLICPGLGTTVTLANSQLGATYQLIDSTTGMAFGGTLMGTGGSLSFPSGPLAADTTFCIESWFVDPHCKRRLDTAIRVRVLPVQRPNLGADSNECWGQGIVLNAGLGFVNYAWSTGQTVASISVNGPGSYEVTVTDGNGCLGADTMIFSWFPQLNVSLGPDTVVCAGQSIGLNAGPGFAGYAWSTGESSQTIVASVASQYMVTVTDVNGCMAMDTFVLGGLNVPFVNLGADTMICGGDSILLNPGIIGLSCNWSTGSTGSSILISQAGDYWLLVVDSLGCESTDSIRIDVAALLQVSLDRLLPLYCLTDPAVQLSGNPVGGNFSGGVDVLGGFDPALAGAGSHSIVYTIVDSLGCIGSDTQTTWVNLPPSPSVAGADGQASTSFALDATLPTIGVGQWSVGDFPGTISDVLDPHAVLLCEVVGRFPFCWTVTQPPCAPSSDTVWVEFEALHIPTGFSPNGDGVNDLYVIRGLDGFPGTKLSIYNRWGDLVWASAAYENHWGGENQTNAPLVDDTYFAILEYGSKKVSTYVVLKR